VLISLLPCLEKIEAAAGSRCVYKWVLQLKQKGNPGGNVSHLVCRFYYVIQSVDRPALLEGRGINYKLGISLILSLNIFYVQ
jgi:hypothetical protein